MLNEADIHIIIIKHLSGETSSEEEGVLKAWLAEDEANQIELDAMKKLWVDTENLPSTTTLDVDSEWDKFKTDKFESKVKIISLWSRASLKYAAILIVALFIGGLYLNSSKTYSTQLDKMTVSLADGSEVILNQHSELKVSRMYGWFNREMELNGEAFFDVEKNPSKPFIIHSEKTHIKVLGTSFNFNTLGNTPSVEVNSGKVAFWNNSSNDTLYLTRGMRGYLQENTLISSEIEDPNYEAWRTGYFSFNQAPLKDVIKLLSNFYETEIKLESDKLQSCLLTTHFENASLEEVLLELQLLMEFEVEENHPNYILKNGQCF